MDAKNDDSAGSDSLDKSLQKKCVVDDMGQGEGATHESNDIDSIDRKSLEREIERQPDNSTRQKTEKSMGDGGIIGTKDDTVKHKAQTKTQIDGLSTVETSSQDNHKSTHNASINTSAPNNNNVNAFETKVKQISKNLKETTLAESASKKTSVEDSTSSSSSEFDQATPSCSSQCNNSSQTFEADANLHGPGETMEDQESRSKKVRFHPDVKENDGGNRVIPKKKKKIKTTLSGEETFSSGQRLPGTDDEMELDEEEDVEEEEEFDLAKTIAEAQDYLKVHPLTFVRPSDKIAGHLQNGLLDEEDLPQLTESSEEEEIYDQVPPENGVERILGKHIKCGKTEFLLRYADRPGLFWEKEDFICKHCPNLLSRYEQNRERRQDRLMRHVAKRQNIRQRYTDF